MQKITIDVTKIKKEKLRNGKYLDLVQFDFKDGKRAKTDKEQNPITSKTGSQLFVVGLVKQDGTKEEDLPILGETTVWVGGEHQEKSDEINPDDIPF